MNVIASILEVIGACGLIAGAFLISLGLGLMVTGALLLSLSIILARKPVPAQ